MSFRQNVVEARFQAPNQILQKWFSTPWLVSLQWISESPVSRNKETDATLVEASRRERSNLMRRLLRGRHGSVMDDFPPYQRQNSGFF